MADEEKTIVIDNGTSRMKIGWAGNAEPYVFPSLIGRARLDVFETYCSFVKDKYIGDEALSKACVLSLKYPIERGIVVNWDDMEMIYYHIFKNELRTDPDEHPVLLTEAPQSPKSNREKMIQIMFEAFNVPSFYVSSQGILSLYSSGRTTGLVCGVGDGVSISFPVYEGYTIQNTILRKNFGGQDVINYFQRILNYRGYNFTTSEEREILREIVEKHSFVSTDYDKDLRKSKFSSENDASYTFSDGNCITISDERFRCTEILFKPEIEGFEFDGIDKMIVDSIKKCDTDMQKDLYENIVLSGGVSMIENFPERVKKEVTHNISESYQVDVIANPDRQYGDWIGGSILASLPTFPQMVITHDEYKDAGAEIVHRKYTF